MGQGTALHAADGLLYARVEGGWVSVDGQGKVSAHRGRAPTAPPPPPTAAPCPSSAAASTPRPSTTDRGGRTFVACPVDAEGRASGGDYVYRVDGATPVLVGARAGDVVAMTFGSGGLLAPENLYLLQAGGNIVYLRPE